MGVQVSQSGIGCERVMWSSSLWVTSCYLEVFVQVEFGEVVLQMDSEVHVLH